jgi:type II secretory pathway pseudopilin PulG
MKQRTGLRQPADQGGYSVVELLVALTIFALVFAAVSIGVGRALDLNRNNRNRSAASYLASRQLEEARSKPFDEVVPGRTACSYQMPPAACGYSIPPSPYTVTQDVTWVAPSSTSSSCNVPNGSSGAALAYKRVTVTVTWPDMRTVAPVASQTLITPPTGVYDRYDGHVGVRLFDRTAAPLAGQTVTLSGPGSDTQVSTEDGCAFFAYLDPGTYTVTLNTAGYVDRQGNQPAVQTASVQAAQITTVQFDYDRAATLEVGLVPPAGAVIPSGIAVTVANSNLTVGTKSFSEASTGSGANRTVTPLFPYASGYQAWAGDCADADPGSYPGGSRGPTLTSDPGGTNSPPGSANLAAVDVVAQRPLGTPLSGATVQAVHAAGTGCPAGETLTSATRTDANGRLRLALPYGTWTIRVTGGSSFAVSIPALLNPLLGSVSVVTVVLP